MSRLPKQTLQPDEFYQRNRDEHSSILDKFSAVDATIPLAKITAGGDNGSLTFKSGILIAYLAPT